MTQNVVDETNIPKESLVSDNFKSLCLPTLQKGMARSSIVENFHEKGTVGHIV